METSPAFTVITCGVNPIPADPAKRNTWIYRNYSCKYSKKYTK